MRRDYRRLHRYIRVGCARRRDGGILYWQAQSPVLLLYLSRSALARLSSRSNFLCGTSCQLLQFFKGLKHLLAVGCKVRTTLSRRNVVSVFHMAMSWSSHSRTFDTLLRLPVLMSEKMRTDCVCVHFKPAHTPKVLQTLVSLERHRVGLNTSSQHDRLSNMIQVPHEVISTHHTMVRHGTYDPADLARILARPDLHPDNVTYLEQWRTTLPPYASCAMSHPHVARCLSVPQDRILSVARWTLPVYGALHFVPLLFFKRAAFTRAPARMALRAAWGTARSTAFLSVAVVIYQGWFCGMQNAYRALAARRAVVPDWLLAAVLSRPAHWIGGILTGLSLFVEAKHRRGELTMYALPKGLESAWVALRGRGLVLHTGNYGNPLVRSFVHFRFPELCGLTLHA